MNDKALLPAGFHDLLFPEAEKKAHIMALLASNLYKFGYELVEPPVIEFENSLFTGAGKALKNQTFRVMDPVSHKMMGVRSDITTQVARIATTRLTKEAKPLRLSYGGDVFRTKGEGLYAERQLTQSGLEIVGIDSSLADAEVVLVAVSALKSLGIKDICVDFTLPRLIGIVLETMKYKKDEKTALLDVINKKNIAEIQKLAGENATTLERLANSDITIQELEKMPLPAKAKLLCARLNDVINIVKESGEGIKISIDPSESSKFSYQSGIGFTIFAKGAKGEIGRGGRYVIEDENAEIPAVGATIYINEILRILTVNKPKDKIFVPKGTKWDAVKALLADDNKMVICAIEEYSNPRQQATLQKCQFIYENGAVKRI